ncbi:unnamed protein product [Sphagnum tenellum]
MGKKGKKPCRQEVNTRAELSPEAANLGSLPPAPALAWKAMTDSSSKQNHPPGLDFDDYPPLSSPSASHSAQTEKPQNEKISTSRPAPSQKPQNEIISELNARVTFLEQKVGELTFHNSKNELIFCAAEILKLSAKGGNDRQQFSGGNSCDHIEVSI